MEKVDLGKRLRTLRKQRKITLQNLSEQANCSVNYLSQVERGLSSPTIETLMRISEALDIRLNDLFAEELHSDFPQVISKNERKSFRKNLSGVTYYALCAPDYQDFLDAFIINLEPGSDTGNVSHKAEGTEFLFVLSGEIDLIFGGQTLCLTTGDSICFDSGKNHYFKNIGASKAEVISIATPPRF